MSEQIVRLVREPHAGHPYEHALADLRRVLGDRAGVGEPDEAGVVEVRVEAAELEEAVKLVFDAMAQSGADDHFEIAEHPEIPYHWKPRPDS
ncbi:MAG: hypothetical protein QOF37_66 [Thermoleophilaceae bacterium]|nr:hypothetical protein [Thermoleophilaceae bacterium]